MIEANERNHVKRTWQLINEISGKKKTTTARMKNEDGKHFESAAESLNAWGSYFNNLLNNNVQIIGSDPLPAQRDLDIDTQPITQFEAQTAIEQLNNGKAPGIDSSITAELIKNGGDFLLSNIHQVC